VDNIWLSMMEKYHLIKYKVMENQGKRKQQIEDSEGIVAFAIIGLIVSIIAAVIQNLIL